MLAYFYCVLSIDIYGCVRTYILLAYELLETQLSNKDVVDVKVGMNRCLMTSNCTTVSVTDRLETQNSTLYQPF